MNGRIYDPLLGRMLSADIAIQAPGNLQSYNRYSYAMNNPLTLKDESGYFWSALITAGFAAYDTYQYATGQQTGTEYAANMALNGAALLADVATLGQGGGLAVRAGNIAVRTARAIDKADTVYTTVNGAIRTAEAVANGDDKGAIVNGLLTVAGAKASASAGDAGKKLDANSIDTKKLDTVDTKTTPAANKTTTRSLEFSGAPLAQGELKASSLLKGNLDTPIFRLAGGDAPSMGRSWTTLDPRTFNSIDEFKQAAGIGKWNDGTEILTGRLKSFDGAVGRTALPIEGIPNPWVPEFRLNQSAESMIELLDPIQLTTP